MCISGKGLKRWQGKRNACTAQEGASIALQGHVGNLFHKQYTGLAAFFFDPVVEVGGSRRLLLSVDEIVLDLFSRPLRLRRVMSDRSSYKIQLLLFFSFGFFSLAAEMLWMRLLSLVLGGERLSVYFTTAGFFLGVALGAWLLNKKVYRSTQPLKWFGWLSVISAIYIGLSMFVFFSLSQRVFPGPVMVWALLLMLPGTFCFGGIFAAMMSIAGRGASDISGLRSSRLYAVETLGGALGILVTLYGLVPHIGLDRAGWCVAITGLLLGLISVNQRAKVASLPDVENPTIQLSSAVLMVGIGFVGLAAEVHLINLLGQVLSNTAYTFGSALLIYLLGISIGAFLQSRLLARVPLTVLFAVYIALLTLSGWGVVLLPEALSDSVPATSLRSVYGREWVILLAIFIGPAVMSGVFFSRLLARFVQAHAGIALALNGVGAAGGSLFVALVGIPFFGLTGTYTAILIVCGFGLLLAVAQARESSPGTVVVLPAMATIVIVFASPQFMGLVKPGDGWIEKQRYEGVGGTVVLSEQNKLPLVQVNQYFMGGQFGFGEARLGHLAMLAHPDPKNVLVLGMGSGVTAGAPLAYTIDQLDVVEVVPELRETLAAFAGQNNKLHDDDRVTIHFEDARSYLKRCTETYDVIIADLFHPARDGAGSLYAQEHFKLIEQCLSDSGVFVQWLPLYQLSEQSLRTITRTCQSVFPESEGVIALYNTEFAVVGLMTRRAPFDTEKIHDHCALQRIPGRFVNGEIDWLSSFWLDAEALRAFCTGGELNTDRFPSITFEAHDVLHRSQSELCMENLRLLMAARSKSPSESKDENALSLAVTKYRLAAEQYLAGEFLRSEASPDPRTLVDLYLEAYRSSVDFKPAHGVLYALAANNPHLGDYILPHMISAHSEYEKPYLVYIEHLQKTGQGQRRSMVLGEYIRRFKKTP
jgi:spermidine synthase